MDHGLGKAQAGLDIAGPDRKGGLVVGHCRFQVAAPVQDVGEIALGIGILRVEVQAAAKGRVGFFGLFLLLQGHAQVVVSAGETRLEGQGRPL